jgi:hypothetical protein
MQAFIEYFIEGGFEAMAMPTIPERVHAIEKSLHSLQGWIKGLTVGAALLIAVVGWWASSQLMPMIQKDETNTAANATAIGEIKGRLDELSGRQAKLEIQHDAGLSPQALAQTLPDFRSAVQIATQQKVKIARTVSNTLSKKLQQIGASAAEYWPAIAEFISYRSFNLVTEDTIKQLAEKSLSNCTDLPLANPVVSKVLNPRQFQYQVPTYENCRVTLDSEKDNQAINKYLLMISPFLRFEHCLVVYRGGPVNLLFYRPSKNGTDLMTATRKLGTTKTKISGKSLQFDDCLFDFSIPNGMPPPDGQKMTVTLLAQNESTLSLSQP